MDEDIKQKMKEILMEELSIHAVYASPNSWEHAWVEIELRLGGEVLSSTKFHIYT